MLGKFILLAATQASLSSAEPAFFKELNKLVATGESAVFGIDIFKETRSNKTVCMRDKNIWRHVRSDRPLFRGVASFAAFYVIEPSGCKKSTAGKVPQYIGDLFLRPREAVLEQMDKWSNKAAVSEGGDSTCWTKEFAVSASDVRYANICIYFASDRTERVEVEIFQERL
jgi:hypothetical protein